MLKILDELNIYVPMKHGSELTDIDGRSVYADRTLVSQRLLFEDQVTVAFHLWCNMHSDYCNDYIIFAGDLGTVMFHPFL